jgi:hypothetical protein
MPIIALTYEPLVQREEKFVNPGQHCVFVGVLFLLVYVLFGFVGTISTEISK